ncbi:Mss4-like protein [Fusarium flagelliforme]|uniref:Glutathione-dependent formaldehyde-activating n=1 Tax=Fusarium flagelliforme TaxID=2675880 RepID=A0A395MZK6_9HYPO|nr:Mss4-like protein [Fusarium flagelliforme]KAH7197487.1 Mss4-like protein [Fusarium flagelliforme]RFN52659.1 glutathione-dependent formaldehyde-activating [Fusarium flagelliforme]
MANSPTRGNSPDMSKSPAVTSTPAVSNLPAVDNSPSMNNSSDTNDLLGIEDLLDMSKLSSTENLPDMDTSPTMDNAPDINNLPDMNTSSAMDNLPTMDSSTDIGNLPDINTLPAMDNSTDMDTSTGTCYLPDLNILPGMDNLTGMGNLPDINTLPTINNPPDINTLSAIDNMNNLPDMDSLPTMTNSPAMSSLSTINNSTIGIDDTDTLPLEGGCACGYARYKITTSFLLVHCCYCTACQRLTGSAFSLNAIIERDRLQLMSGEPSSNAGTPSNPTPVPTAVQPAFAGLTMAESARDATLAPEARFGACIPTESGVGQTVWRCPKCTISMWSYYGDGGPHLAYVRVGTLDKPWEIKPDVHIYTRSRPSWLAANDGKPSFEEYYPDREELMSEAARMRYEAIKPKMKRFGSLMVAGW